MQRIKDLWSILPPPCQKWAGYVLGVVFVLGTSAWIFNQVGSEIREEWFSGGIEVSPFEWAQLQEGREHSGEESSLIKNTDGLLVAFYSSDSCVLVRHKLPGGRASRTWVMHPFKFGSPPPAPDHLGEYATPPSGAGLLISRGCDPLDACVQMDQHPGRMQPVRDDQVDQCWAWRYFQYVSPDGYTDGCTGTVPYNACTNWYQWDMARWVCCYYH